MTIFRLAFANWPTVLANVNSAQGELALGVEQGRLIHRSVSAVELQARARGADREGDVLTAPPARRQLCRRGRGRAGCQAHGHEQAKMPHHRIIGSAVRAEAAEQEMLTKPARASELRS